MNTTNIQTATVALKDGRTTLVSWSQKFDSALTIGDVISVSSHWTTPLPGFTDQARVTRIELDTKTGRHHIEAEAIATTDRRPVIFLNSSRIPAHLQDKVETYLRRQVQLALPSWEESNDTMPILRIHENGHSLKESLPVLQADVLKMLNAEIQPAGV